MLWATRFNLIFSSKENKLKRTWSLDSFRILISLTMTYFRRLCAELWFALQRTPARKLEEELDERDRTLKTYMCAVMAEAVMRPERKRVKSDCRNGGPQPHAAPGRVGRTRSGRTNRPACRREGRVKGWAEQRKTQSTHAEAGQAMGVSPSRTPGLAAPPWRRRRQHRKFTVFFDLFGKFWRRRHQHRKFIVFFNLFFGKSWRRRRQHQNLIVFLIVCWGRFWRRRRQHWKLIVLFLIFWENSANTGGVSFFSDLLEKSGAEGANTGGIVF